MYPRRRCHFSDFHLTGAARPVAIWPGVASKQGVAAGHGQREELGVLLTHGILHLLGYDHAEPEEERLMFGLQGQLVAEWNRRISQ